MDVNEEAHDALERRIYARWLEIGTRLGFVILLASFALYVTGVLPPAVPLERLPDVWSLPVADYLRVTHGATGWGWVTHLQDGDDANFIGVAVLSSVTLVCYARLLPVLVTAGERVLAWICAGEIVVLAVAASGVIAGH